MYGPLCLLAFQLYASLEHYSSPSLDSRLVTFSLHTRFGSQSTIHLTLPFSQLTIFISFLLVSLLLSFEGSIPEIRIRYTLPFYNSFFLSKLICFMIYISPACAYICWFLVLAHIFRIFCSYVHSLFFLQLLSEFGIYFVAWFFLDALEDICIMFVSFLVPYE